MAHKIGVISDTHGIWHPSIPNIFEGVDAILHAGDVGSLAILTRLQAIAPVTAVRGNCDALAMAHLQESAVVEFSGVRIAVIHGHQFDHASITQAACEHFASYAPHVVVHGHTHKPKVERHVGMHVLNPGSVQAADQSMAQTVGLLEILERGSHTFTLCDLRNGNRQVSRLE